MSEERELTPSSNGDVNDMTDDDQMAPQENGTQRFKSNRPASLDKKDSEPADQTTNDVNGVEVDSNGVNGVTKMPASNSDDVTPEKPSKFVTGFLCMVHGFLLMLKTGAENLKGLLTATLTFLPATTGVGLYLGAVYISVVCFAEPRDPAEFPDLMSKLVLGLQAGVWVYLPTFLRNWKMTPSGGAASQTFQQANLIFWNMLLVTSRLDSDCVHTVEVAARIFAAFSMLQLLCEWLCLDSLATSLSAVWDSAAPCLFLYNLYHVLYKDIGHMFQSAETEELQPQSEPEPVSTEQTSSGWFLF